MAHIVATITFLRTEDGGRASPLPAGRVGYILEINNQNFSCWLLNSGDSVVKPGDCARLEIVLAAPELAMPLLNEGVDFALRDEREVARGVVSKVIE